MPPARGVTPLLNAMQCFQGVDQLQSVLETPAIMNIQYYY